MPAAQLPSRKPRAALEEPPPCPKCHSGMQIVDMVPGLGHLAHRIFKCGECGHVQIMPE